jgi:replication factor C subunit 1
MKTETPKASPLPHTNGKKATKPSKHQDNEDFEDLDNDDDVFTAQYKKNKDDAYEEDSDLEELSQVKPATKGKIKKTEEEDDDFMDVDMDDDVKSKPKKASKPRKRKPDELDAQDDTPKKGRGPAGNSKKSKKEPAEDSAGIKAVFDDIPLVRPPTPPPRDQDGKYKVNWRGNRAAPASAGTKDIPEGAENCLAGLSFVFTGVLEGLDRETGTNLVKRYGGKVQGAPTKKTGYVVLGADAGPSKLNIIAQHKLKTINEDGLFQLIKTLPAHGGSGAAAQVAMEKLQKEQSNALQQAKLMEEQEREEKRAIAKQQQKATVAGTTPRAATKVVNSDNKLWTVKYAPTSLEQIVGNKGQVEKLAVWLRNFHKNSRLGFKLAGKDGSGIYRSVIIYGPPGIGKTTAAHLVAKLEGYDVVESNASDTRSKRLIEDGLKGVLGTTSLLGYFAGDGKAVDESKRKLVLIMDEVDGMSAGDRGGVGAMAAICKKSKIPIILICNDRKLPKMRPFDNVAYDLPFRRPTTDQIRSRLMTIAYREKLKIPPNVINALIEGTGADIRQTVNMISTVKLDDQNLDFGKGKEMSKAWEKHVVLKPWDITAKILGGAMFDKNSKTKLNDKIELYFNDHEFSFLMLQENYLGTQPVLANQFQGMERKLKLLELAENASASISDGDLVDRLIHGTQQQWSLMPTHAVFSFVRPASFMAGNLGYGSTSFTSWLGNNSKLGKLTRMVKEIQGHMRLRSSADRHEVRQQYVPMFWNKLPKRLERDGKDAIQEVIDLMDSYFLTKDDFDAIMELGIGNMDEKNVKIETAAKSAFTRT